MISSNQVNIKEGEILVVNMPDDTQLILSLDNGNLLKLSSVKCNMGILPFAPNAFDIVKTNIQKIKTS